MDICSENQQTTICLETMGCKLNQAETELLQIQLEGAGCRIVSAGEKVDIYILNTCTVTHISDRKSRHLLRMARRKNPGACIIVTGCYAERSAREISEIEGVDLVIGNKDKLNLPRILIERGYIKQVEIDTVSGHTNRTRSFIKVQDGCSSFCSYCIVPFVRGREKSLPPEEIINTVKQRTADGYRELVLTGTEIGHYHYGRLDLQSLIERILNETEIDRLRLSSLQPQELSTELIHLWQNPRLCRHFHLSLQSGSDKVLRLMGRRYSTQDYFKVTSYLRSAIPEVAITTDVIVGFPGETEEDFREGFDFCRRMRFARIHVFPYSLRRGTGAAEMSGHIEASMKKQRSEKMLELAKNCLREYNRTFIGSTLNVLFEHKLKECWEGLTDNYIRVYVSSTDNLVNHILPVNIVELKSDGVRGLIPA